MMFSAGMGIGLMFYGVNEPLTFFADGGDFAVPGTDGLTPGRAAPRPRWPDAVPLDAAPVGDLRRGGPRHRLRHLPQGPPPADQRGVRARCSASGADGPAGRVIDILAIFATLFGSAASLGLGALQIGSGLQIVAGLGEAGNGLLVGIIAVLTVCFVLSAVSGVAKGIQWLSNINMVLALALAVFVFVVGPTLFVLDLLPTAIAAYFGDLPDDGRPHRRPGGDVATWLSGYTVFYWAWWISWTPFVGMFIARISRGRTIRQFVTGVLLVPSLVSLVWFAIFGGSGDQAADGRHDIYGAGGAEGQLFALLEQFPSPRSPASW